MYPLSKAARKRKSKYARESKAREGSSKDALADFWTYAHHDRVFLRRVSNSLWWEIEDQATRVSYTRLNSWLQRGWVEAEYRLDGNDQIADVTLTEAGMVALWGDC